MDRLGSNEAADLHYAGNLPKFLAIQHLRVVTTSLQTHCIQSFEENIRRMVALERQVSVR